MVDEKNFINIQGWMVTQLGLSGNELLCYALIYGFSQDGQSYFSASSKYISEWLNISRRSVIDLLDRMTKKGLLEKKEKITNGIKLCDYRVTSQDMKKLHRVYEETSQGGEETSHHNIIDNIKDNNKKKEIYKESFEEWWKIYPRKVGKEGAYKKYNTLLKEKKVTVEQLKKGVELYADKCKNENTETKFIKHPITWLNQGCWQDEYVTINDFGRTEKEQKEWDEFIAKALAEEELERLKHSDGRTNR